MNTLFITGVGTGVGKTLVTTILCQQRRASGKGTVALKPVVSGYVPGDTESDPALILRSLGLDPSDSAIASISPWRLAAPISPHLAARREHRTIALDEVARFCRDATPAPGSIRLIEGAGGVMSPLCDDGTCLDLVATLGVPAVLVTGTYLGAISHTLTAMAALGTRRVPVRGIVVSDSIDGVGLAETIESLREFGAGSRPIFPLPRLAGDPESRWRSAPPLVRLCESDDG